MLFYTRFKFRMYKYIITPYPCYPFVLFDASQYALFDKIKNTSPLP